MTYTIGWSEGQAEVTTAEEAGVVLDRIAATPKSVYLLQVGPNDDSSVMELIWGHPDRAAVMYADDVRGARAFEPSIPPLAKDINYDYGSIEPEFTRVTAAAARLAVQEYVSTGRQPTNLSWLDE
jgi:hypothetical protein